MLHVAAELTCRWSPLISGAGRGAQLAEIWDVVVEGAGADAEELGDRGHTVLWVGEQVACGPDQVVVDDGGPPTDAAASPSWVPATMSSRVIMWTLLVRQAPDDRADSRSGRRSLLINE